jgi:hypothetical protein
VPQALASPRVAAFERAAVQNRRRASEHIFHETSAAKKNLSTRHRRRERTILDELRAGC